jgi:phosphate transport system substrate-binding protein
LRFQARGSLARHARPSCDGSRRRARHEGRRKLQQEHLDAERHAVSQGSRGREGGYTKKWDLSDLPHYTPKRQLTGKLRIWGNNYLKDGYLGEYWRAVFNKFQPGIEIEYNLPTTGIAIPSLAAKASDLAISRKAILMDLLTFEQVYHHSVSEVSAVTGSYDVYGWTPALIIAVHKENPVDKISMRQLDGVFGGQRLGGYVGSVWRTDYPCRRGAEVWEGRIRSVTQSGSAVQSCTYW